MNIGIELGFHWEIRLIMEEIKLKNGNIVKVLEPKSEVMRGKRRELHLIDDYMGFKLRWYQKIYIWIYSLWIDVTKKKRWYK